MTFEAISHSLKTYHTLVANGRNTTQPSSLHLSLHTCHTVLDGLSHASTSSLLVINWTTCSYVYVQVYVYILCSIRVGFVCLLSPQSSAGWGGRLQRVVWEDALPALPHPAVGREKPVQCLVLQEANHIPQLPDGWIKGTTRTHVYSDVVCVLTIMFWLVLGLSVLKRVFECPGC